MLFKHFFNTMKLSTICFLPVILVGIGLGLQTSSHRGSIAEIKDGKNGVYITDGNVQRTDSGVSISDDTGALSAYNCQSAKTGYAEMKLQKQGDSYTCLRVTSIKKTAHLLEVWQKEQRIDGLYVQTRKGWIRVEFIKNPSGEYLSLPDKILE